MQTKITETTNIGGLGSPATRKLLKVQSGISNGRLVAMVKTSNNEIKYSTSLNPFNSWSDMITVASDSANAPFDVVMNPVGDLYLVYVESSTNFLVAVKLSIDESGWNIGPKIYIYNDNLTNTPSITIDNTGILYTTFARFNGVAFDLQVKSSTDDGLTWNTGPADVGETLISDVSIVIPKIMTTSDNIFVVYTVDYTDIKERHRSQSGGSWSTEYTIGSGSSISTNFDAVVLPEGFLGVVYDDDQLIYREFNSVNWSPSTIIDSKSAFSPQLKVINNIPVVFYISERDTYQRQLLQSNRITGSFSTPIPFEPKSDIFDSVLLYDSVSSSFSDKTLESSSNTSADVFHPSSAALCEQVGDRLFLGSGDRFRFIHIDLSTTGIGGSLTYSYFDGLNWIAFTPAGGNYQFDSSSKELILWQDFDSVPGQWQKTVIDEESRFWIKIEVVSAFTTSPVGSQITAISNLNAISVRS